jgi:DNA-binding NarL/FixJ family response regulator
MVKRLELEQDARERGFINHQQAVICFLEGKNTQTIAQELSVKSNTISTVKNRLYEKLHVSNIVELIQLYN